MRSTIGGTLLDARSCRSQTELCRLGHTQIPGSASLSKSLSFWHSTLRQDRASHSTRVSRYHSVRYQSWTSLGARAGGYLDRVPVLHPQRLFGCLVLEPGSSRTYITTGQGMKMPSVIGSSYVAVSDIA
eukprot:1696463-Rhodomonas_salina.4